MKVGFYSLLGVIFAFVLTGCPGGSGGGGNGGGDQPDVNITGTLSWDRTNGGSSSDEFRDVAVDSNGNIYAVGHTRSSDHDIVENNRGSNDALIMKFNSDGTLLWARTFGGSGPDNFRTVALDSNGNIYAVGYSDSNDGNITDGNNGGYDGLIVKYDSDGNVLWHRTFGGDLDEYIEGVAIDSNNNIFVCGNTKSTNEDITDGNNGLYDGLVMKFDASGSIVWNKTFGGTGVDYFQDIAIDSQDNIYIGGYVLVVDGDITESGEGGIEAILVKFNNSNGATIFHRLFGGSDSDYFEEIVIDGNDNLYLIGYTYSNDGDISNGNKGGSDMLIVKYTTTGNVVWDRTFGSSSDEYIYGGAVDISGNVYAIGYNYLSDEDVTDGNNGGDDGIVIKYDGDGNAIWHRTLGGSGDFDDLYNGATDADGNLYLVGFTVSNDFDITDGNYGSTDTLMYKLQ